MNRIPMFPPGYTVLRVKQSKGTYKWELSLQHAAAEFKYVGVFDYKEEASKEAWRLFNNVRELTDAETSPAPYEPDWIPRGYDEDGEVL